MAEAPETPAIYVQGLTKRFGTVVALDNVRFSVKAGELFFLLGPSGCGKSTLLRILAGLEKPDSGTVRFGEVDVSQLPPHRRGAPMVFQNYALWPHLSVKDNVAFGLVERRAGKADIDRRVEAALDQVELEGLGHRMPGQLSGGQQQRVALARALVVNPQIVLLDEPLSNLDAKLRLEMRREIERLHERTDLTLIYVTHDQTEALGLADRMAVMEAGCIRAVGAPRELYHRPPNRFCAKFLGEANLIPGRVMETDAEGGFVSVATSFGVWKGVLGGNAKVADQEEVACMVRPENLRIVISSEMPNAFKGSVESVRLNGSTISVRLRAQNEEINATVLSHTELQLHAGQEHAWSASPEDTVILPADAKAEAETA